MDGDLSDFELQKKLRATNKNYAKKINISLRGSNDEFQPFIIPAIQVGGRMFLSHPIGAGESELEGGNFMDFINKVKDIATIPFKIATMPLQMIKSAVMGSGEEQEQLQNSDPNGAGFFQYVHDQTFGKSKGGKGRKPRAKKGGADSNKYLGPNEVVYTKAIKPVRPKVIAEATHETVKRHVTDDGKFSVPFAEGKGKGKSRKNKKGGSLLSSLSDIANIMPSVFPTELDNWIPPEVTRGIAKKIAEKVSGGAQTRGAKKIRKPNRWLEHVKNVRAKNPSMKYKDVLVFAKQSYK